MKLRFAILCSALFLASLTIGQTINDIDEFRDKELKEPYKSYLDYLVHGVRGLREGYFSKYRYGKVRPEILRNDDKCFGRD